MKTREELFEHIFNLLDRMEALADDMSDDAENEETVELIESEQTCFPKNETS